MSQENYIWKINNLELPLDLEDADAYDNLMAAFDEMDEEEKRVEKSDNPIRAYCAMWYRFYDLVFGDGIGDKIFNGKHNARLCDETYEKFLEFIQKQGQNNAKRRMGVVNKYSPNRQQRRVNNRRNNKNRHKNQYHGRYSGPYAL